jgi:UDP-GlcNAc3NAcA epimerase
MKIVTIVGARPQFIKASALSRVIANHNADHASPKVNEVIIHTGQHFDQNMSDVFFKELDIPKPDFNLGINSKSHGAMTGQMLERIEEILQRENPDRVVVYGDTNSTLAGSLAAAKLLVPVAHIEAGLRSFNMTMPEEINRIISDRVSDLLFCPTDTAVINLSREGISAGVFNVGDVMYDVSLFLREKALSSFSLSNWDVTEKEYALCTVHRQENTDNKERLENIFRALQHISRETDILLPLHPRTRKKIIEQGLEHLLEGINIIEPLSYLAMLRLEISAKAIFTDSGGIQKEAFFYKIPCLTLRDETEWVETLENGRNRLCGADYKTILESWEQLSAMPVAEASMPYGDGAAADKILSILREHDSNHESPLNLAGNL